MIMTKTVIVSQSDSDTGSNERLQDACDWAVKDVQGKIIVLLLLIKISLIQIQMTLPKV